jgi:uncharacterized membrane protein
LVATGYGETIDIGSVLQRGFAVVWHNAAGFMLAAAVFVGVPSFLIEYLAAPDTQAMLDDGGFAWAGLMFVLALFYVFGTSLLQVAVVRSSILRLNGRPAEFGRSLGTTLGFVLPVFGLSIVYALGVGLGLVLLVVPGIIVMCMWFVAVPVLVEERAGIMGSLSRSAELTSGSRWQVFALIIILSLLGWVLGLVFGIFPATAVPENTVFIALCNAIAAAVSGVFGAAVGASLYIELRQVREGATTDNLAAIFD